MVGDVLTGICSSCLQLLMMLLCLCLDKMWSLAGNDKVSGARTATHEAAYRLGPWHLHVCVAPAHILFLAALQSVPWSGLYSYLYTTCTRYLCI